MKFEDYDDLETVKKREEKRKRERLSEKRITQGMFLLIAESHPSIERTLLLLSLSLSKSITECKELVGEKILKSHEKIERAGRVTLKGV